MTLFFHLRTIINYAPPMLTREQILLQTICSSRQAYGHNKTIIFIFNCKIDVNYN